MQYLLNIPNFDVYLVLGILVFFGLIETISGQLQKSKRTKNDWIQEAGSFFILSGLIKPAIVLCVFFVGNLLIPQQTTFFSNWSVWLVLPLYLFVDDFLQYWYHRTAHENAFLWKLHRAHHQAEEMGYFVSYRNAGLYYIMMPNIWWIGLITFLGGGTGVAIGLVLKQLVIVGSHSTVKWDAIFYEHRFLKPIIGFLQRIIITPAFHHAHHGKSKLDGISDPNGNFGNMFSIWDQLFGSAQFVQAYPKDYGLPKPTQDTWQAAYLYPLIKSKDEKSELAKGYNKRDTTIKEPSIIELEKGQKCLWCKCGLSKDQPFCDGSHHGTKHKPVLFEAKRTGKVKLCNCKLTQNPPYCDGAHKGTNNS